MGSQYDNGPQSFWRVIHHQVSTVAYLSNRPSVRHNIAGPWQAGHQYVDPLCMHAAVRHGMAVCAGMHKSLLQTGG